MFAKVFGGFSLGLGLAFVPALAQADGATNVFNPASPQDTSIVSLFWFTIVVAVIIFVGVTGTLLYSAIAHRERPGREPSQFRKNTRVEIAWTAAPAVLLAVVLAMSIQTMGTITTPAANSLDVTVIGHQWWWELRYPSAGITTANELHVPAGQSIVLNLQSADVIHSFWVPQLAGKTDLVPGHPNILVFTAQRPGTYEGQCSEFCGVGHAWMRLRVISQSPADFATWERAQQQAATPPTGGLALQGEQLFASATCATCHAIDGTTASGTGGPNLTHIGSRATLGAGVLDNTSANLDEWLTDPQAIKPGTLMPNFKLTAAEVAALTAYLESLR